MSLTIIIWIVSIYLLIGMVIAYIVAMMMWPSDKFLAEMEKHEEYSDKLKHQLDLMRMSCENDHSRAAIMFTMIIVGWFFAPFMVDKG